MRIGNLRPIGVKCRQPKSNNCRNSLYTNVYWRNTGFRDSVCFICEYSRASLQAETFVHQPLQAWFVQNVVSKFFVGEHCQRGSLGTGHQFGSFFDGEVWILTNHRHHHADHDLQASDISRLLLSFTANHRLSTPFQTTHLAPALLDVSRLTHVALALANYCRGMECEVQWSRWC